jgi:hypothetical protein
MLTTRFTMSSLTSHRSLADLCNGGRYSSPSRALSASRVRIPQSPPPPCGYGRNPIGSDGVVTKFFLAFLATNQDLLQFLKDIRPIRSQMMRSKCGSSMTWVSCPHRPDGYVWLCRKGPRTSRCSRVTSIRHGP